MSGIKIKDATGKDYGAKVDNTKRLYTRGVAEEGAIEALRSGNHFALSSGPITLTGTTQNAMLWFRNDENMPLLIDRIIVQLDESTGGTDSYATVYVHGQPTGMTGGSGNDVTQVNTNFGNSNRINSTNEKGADGATIDEGSVYGAWRLELPSRFKVIEVRWWLEKGASIGISYQPPTGNTSLWGVVALNAHLITNF